MKPAARRAATRRGSSNSQRPASCAVASSKASGTLVVLPAPGWATRIQRLCVPRAHSSSANTDSMGRVTRAPPPRAECEPDHRRRPSARLPHRHAIDAPELTLLLWEQTVLRCHSAPPGHRPADGGKPPARAGTSPRKASSRSEEHTSELQSRENLVCRLVLGKNNA